MNINIEQNEKTCTEDVHTLHFDSNKKKTCFKKKSVMVNKKKVGE